MMSSTKWIGFAVLSLMAVMAGRAESALLVNGNFETGDFTGWTAYNTASGTSTKSVDTFDVSGAGASFAAKFNPLGLTSGGYGIGDYQGGGVFQSVLLAGGDYTLTADTASTNTGNLDGGVVSLLVDGSVVASYDYSSVGGTNRFTLSAALIGLSAGSHEFKIQATRNYYPASNVSDYFDNVVLTSAIAPAAVPEPSTIISAGIAGLMGIGYAWRRRQA